MTQYFADDDSSEIKEELDFNEFLHTETYKKYDKRQQEKKIDDIGTIGTKKTKRNVNAKEYVNNKEMTRVISEWIYDVKRLKQKPVMPDYLGECFLKIVNNYGNKFNFRNYTYLEDMKSEALLTCIKYAHNFDPEKSNNAFAYFTQITKFCFLQIISKEKHQGDIKQKKINESSIYNYELINLYDVDSEYGAHAE